MFQRLAGMEAGYGKRRGHGHYIHAGRNASPNPVGRILKHQTLLGWNL
jgi:hypothetical protein